MNNHIFTGKIISEMLNDGVSIQLNKRVYNTKHSYSYFVEESKPLLVVNYFLKDGKINTKWLDTLVHEYNHYIQWKYEFNKWNKYGSCIASFDDYFTGETKRINKKTIYNIVKLEHDCETKAIATIKKYKLKINLTNYIQDANNYLMAHEFIVKYKSFDFPAVGSKLRKIIPTELMSLSAIKRRIPEYDALCEEYFSKKIK